MAAGLDLGKQVGPLPIGGWIAVVGGGLVVGYFINKGQAQQDAAAQQTQLTESGIGTGGSQFIYDEPENMKPQGPDVEKTNDQWGREVTNWLIGRGVDPYKADNMVRKYLSGEPLNAEERGMINLALTHFGAPPEPLPPVDQPETETPSPTTDKPGALQSFVIYRNPGVNLLAYRVDDKTKWVDISIRGSNGYRFDVRQAVLPGGGQYRYSHFQPPQWRGVTFGYYITPVNEAGAGPQAVRRTQFTGGYAPAVTR